MSRGLGDVYKRQTLNRMSHLTFEEPDAIRFPAIKLGHYALRKGGNTACVINAANEIAVAAFLHEQISFTRIYPLIMETLEAIPYVAKPTLEDYIATNAAAREHACRLVAAIR